MPNEEWIEKLKQTKLILQKEEIDKMVVAKTIDIEGKEINKVFLQEAIKNPKYYPYLQKYFNNEIENFGVTAIVNGDVYRSFYATKTEIIKGIKKLIEDKELFLTEEENYKFEELEKLVSFDKFNEDYKDKSYEIDIENKHLSIAASHISYILNLSPEDLKNLCMQENLKTINGIKKEEFIYAAMKFLNDEKLNNNYLLPDNIKENAKEIRKMQIIDIQAINKYLKTKDEKHKEFTINPLLEEKILEGLPNASDLEKAIYIYIKMCKTLSYDDEYFAVNQQGKATEKHRNIEYASSITPENNKVVCFEFNMIYSKMLEKLGLNFESDYLNMAEESYGYGHASLEFRSDKFLVSADSVTSILESDMFSAKLDQPLIGISCLNINEKTKKEFKDKLTKMYALASSQEKNINYPKVEHIKTKEEIIREYKEKTNNIKPIDFEEKFDILKNKLSDSNTQGMDLISYAKQLSKILFTDPERKNNIKYSIIRENLSQEDDRIAKATGIFAVNETGFEENLDNSKYYVIDTTGNISHITPEALEERFNSKVYEYIDDDDPKIPGIYVDGGVQR